MPNENMILFESPVCHLIRHSLKVEYLSDKAHAYAQSGRPFDIQTCVATIIEFLALLDKSELHCKYYQEFAHAHHVISRIEKEESVCQGKVKQTLADLQRLLNLLSNKKGKFAEDLRENHFFKQIIKPNLRLGSEYDFLSPGYYLWLNQPTQKCLSDIETWLSHFNTIIDISRTHLKLIRESGYCQQKVASDGFFQEALEKPCQLIRLEFDKSLMIYPIISAGNHGVSIQFFQSAHFSKPSHKYTDDIPFNIYYCFLS